MSNLESYIPISFFTICMWHCIRDWIINDQFGCLSELQRVPNVKKELAIYQNKSWYQSVFTEHT